MRKFIKLLGIVGFGGLGLLILGVILQLSQLMIIGMVMLLGCAAAVILCNALVGYNPADESSC